jgi:hypothetical protein
LFFSPFVPRNGLAKEKGGRKIKEIKKGGRRRKKGRREEEERKQGGREEEERRTKEKKGGRRLPRTEPRSPLS